MVAYKMGPSSGRAGRGGHFDFATAWGVLSQRIATRGQMTEQNSEWITDDEIVPVELNLKEAERILQVTWSDGHLSPYPLEYLRGWCPCAVCQGHFSTELNYVESEGLNMLGAEPVGRYGAKVIWSDGHDTGIYAFAYLKSMCACPACDPSGIKMTERQRHR